ncbi:hypothetical protein [Candidatus Symbiopectobacterium sp. NZEC135]|uniref:hypothetical protein n=1 Tax=Candidatus Symbiopectobacterium sp. NZEC135 TaxID=2820471 RepID=UPI002225DB91|nr:hypothetical protein [Candidatus Symbiopectobacterium sp. NZEC135]MCW2478073.1 hypothetical protein [Candidatus Symbiopectobacterium sp. NZEC135]
MKFSTEQLEAITNEEKQSFIKDIIGEIKSKYPQVIQDDIECEMRLTEALDYAESLGIHDTGLLRIFLYLEACEPGYAKSIPIRTALEESNNPEQRYRDIINSALNLAKRT